jgi:hypothetical protein
LKIFLVFIARKYRITRNYREYKKKKKNGDEKKGRIVAAFYTEVAIS